MWLTESLQHRLQQPEMMDQPTLDPTRHIQALRGLERINYLSGCAGSYWPAIREAAGAASGKPLRVLDVATGAGDVPLRLWHRAKRAGLNVEIEGCDRSSVAVEHARRRARGSASTGPILPGRYPGWAIFRAVRRGDVFSFPASSHRGRSNPGSADHGPGCPVSGAGQRFAPFPARLVARLGRDKDVDDVTSGPF